MRLFEKEKIDNQKIVNILKFKIKNPIDKIINKIKAKNRIVRNVFNTNYPDKVLISYLTRPFVRRIRYSHSNQLECYTAAEIFHELGYCVDVIEYTDFFDASNLCDYKIVYGFGNALRESLKKRDIKSIFYGPGCNPLYSNKLTLNKVLSFYKKTGVFAFSSSRYAEEDYNSVLYFSDLIIALGNKFVADTYKVEGIEQNIKNLNCFFYDKYDINIEAKNFDTIKNNFLWFGSAGLLHKGLDIVLEIFKKRPDLNLFICGANEYEKEFFEYYQKELNNEMPNIKNLGFLDIEEKAFKDVMDNCVGVVSPSLSEGGAVAVLTVMGNGGLIPIITKSSGLDVEEYGFVFDDISTNAVEEMINKLLDYPIIELKELSKKVKSQTREIYNYENYKRNLKNIIASVAT